MKLLHDDVRITSWDRWTDSGDYPSGAGAGPLPDGPDYPEEIDGYCVWRVNSEERSLLEVQFKDWLDAKKEYGLDEADSPLCDLADMSVDYDGATLREFRFVFIAEQFALVVPTLWDIDDNDHGDKDGAISLKEIRTAIKMLQDKGYLAIPECHLADAEGDCTTMYDLASDCEIRIMSNRNPLAYTTMGSKVVGAIFEAWNGEEYTFDVVVHPEYRSMGIASELIDRAIWEFDASFGEQEGAAICADVINPQMVAPLERRGLITHDVVGPHTLMKRKGDVKITCTPDARCPEEYSVVELVRFDGKKLRGTVKRQPDGKCAYVGHSQNDFSVLRPHSLLVAATAMCGNPLAPEKTVNWPMLCERMREQK